MLRLQLNQPLLWVVFSCYDDLIVVEFLGALSNHHDVHFVLVFPIGVTSQSPTLGVLPLTNISSKSSSVLSREVEAFFLEGGSVTFASVVSFFTP